MPIALQMENLKNALNIFDWKAYQSGAPFRAAGGHRASIIHRGMMTGQRTKWNHFLVQIFTIVIRKSAMKQTF